jgi:hypothetical protein
MTDQLRSLLDDLHALVQLLNNQKPKKGAQPVEGQILARGPDTVLASKLKNASVTSPDEKRIGEVNDLIIKADGTVAGLVIGVGGDKNIALKFERFKLTPEPDGRARIMLSANKEELQQAADFKSGVEQKPEET